MIKPQTSSLLDPPKGDFIDPALIDMIDLLSDELAMAGLSDGALTESTRKLVFKLANAFGGKSVTVSDNARKAWRAWQEHSQSLDDDKPFQLGDKALTNPDTGDLGEFFGAMTDHLRAVFLQAGLDNELVNKAIHDAVLSLSSGFAGEMIYVSNKPKEVAQAMAIYADLQHMPHHLVDRKYGLSRGYSLKVAQKIRERKQAREQLRLGL